MPRTLETFMDALCEQVKRDLGRPICAEDLPGIRGFLGLPARAFEGPAPASGRELLAQLGGRVDVGALFVRLAGGDDALCLEQLAGVRDRHGLFHITDASLEEVVRTYADAEGRIPADTLASVL